MLGHPSVGGGSLLGVLSTPGFPHPIPGVAAVHEQPPSTLQLVNLLAQLLNLFRQAALCQADRVGAREGQRRGRGTKRTAELRRSRRTPCKVPGQTHITLRDEVQLRVSGSAGGRARKGGLSGDRLYQSACRALTPHLAWHARLGGRGALCPPDVADAAEAGTAANPPRITDSPRRVLLPSPSLGPTPLLPPLCPELWPQILYVWVNASTGKALGG